ncbi:MAG: glutamyl-tRNA reductase [Planctomycetota bacterium]|nr:glutamyl-tRNA reductase [Planctomycetota bacterium]
MQVQLLGCSHQNSPISVRERLAFTPDQARAALSSLRRKFPKVEAVLLSTCNRVELYTASELGGAPTSRQVVEFLADFHQLDPASIIEHLYDRNGRESVRHLFIVASSLDSMVVGEPQISSQVKFAYQLATQQEATGPLTHAVFQAAARVARRVASETAIHERRVSIPSVAVAEFAGQIFERFDDKQTLVIGAGEMAEETLQYLQDRQARHVTIVNRNPQRAMELAQRRQGRASPWEHLLDELAVADLVISATGAAEPIVTDAMFAPLARSRGARPWFILDLAVPRDFDPAIGLRPGVYLYSVDDLRAACERNRLEREKELPKALRIIDQETEAFMVELHFRATGPVIKRLRALWEKPKEEELQRLLNKLPQLDDRASREIRIAFDRLTNKLFHPPLESLRDASRHGVPTTLLEALTRLFQFKD